mgnify:CR=1 FL=1
MSAVLGFGRFSGHLAWLLLAGSLVACGGSSDSGGGAAARPSMMVGALSDQYTPLSRWICHPDLPDSDDACATGMETLSVAASGEATVLPFERATDPGFDCFYAYPTASLDPANRDTVLQLIEEAKANGTAIVGIFHDHAARQRIADREVDMSAFAPRPA